MPQDIPGGFSLENPFLSNDSIVALQIDTKNRIDRLNGEMTDPIPYPMPTFSGTSRNLSTTSSQPSQQQLLDHNFTTGSVGNSFLLGDKRAGNIAANRIRYKSSAYNPAEKGYGLTTQFEYDPVMDKYINGKYGYDPYIGIAGNENVYYNDYLSKSLPSRIGTNVLVGLGRFVTGVAAKTVGTFGYLGSMIGNGVEELFDPTGNNAMADIANNSLSRWAEVNWEENWKNSAALSVFKPDNWEKMGFWEKMGNGAFWTDEVADGAAFMGEMVLTTYLTGGLARVAGLAKLGATGINTAAKLSRFGNVAGKVGKTIDWTLKIGTGADDVAGIGRWALLTTSESAVESSHQYHSTKEDLISKRRMGMPGFENLTDAEIERRAGDAAAASFRGNMTVLAVSNAFENRLIWNKIFKRGRASDAPEFGKSKPANIDVNTSGKTMSEIGKASYREFKYSTKLGKFFDWKNGLSKTRFYGWMGARAIAVEGLWEENAQLAIERLSADDNYRTLGFGSQFVKILSKTRDQTVDAFLGKDVQASTAIGLGAVIGLGGGSVVTKVFGGEKLFRGERRQAILDTKELIDVYETNRAKMFSFFNIWKKDKDGKFIKDENGNLEFDPIAAEAILSSLYGNLDHLSKMDEVQNPAIRQHMMNSFVQDFVYAAKKAGIFDRSLQSIERIKDLTPEEVLELGFDPASQVDHKQVVENLEQTGKEYDQVYNNPLNKEYYTREDRIDEEKRKYASFREKGMIRSVKALSDEWSSELDQLLLENIDFESAGRSRSDIREINSLNLQLKSLEQYENEVLNKLDSKFLSTFITERKQKLKERLDSLMSLYEQDIKDGKLSVYNVEGGASILYAGQTLILESFREKGKAIAEADIVMFVDSAKKLAEFENALAKFKYVDGLLDISNPNSLKNYREYQSFYDEIQEKIQVTLDEERLVLIKRQIEELKAKKDPLTDEEKKILNQLETQEKELTKKLEERDKKKKEEEEKTKEKEKTEGKPKEESKKKTEEKPKEEPLTEQQKEKKKAEDNKIDYLISRLKLLSSSQQRRTEAKFSLDQIEQELKVKIDNLIANGATKEDAERIANEELTVKDREAKDKLTQEIQLLNDQEDEMIITLQSDLLKITDRESIAQKIKDLVNEERNDDLNFVLYTIIEGSDLLRVRYKDLNTFILDKIDNAEKITKEEEEEEEEEEKPEEEKPEGPGQGTPEEVNVDEEIKKLKEKNTKSTSIDNRNTDLFPDTITYGALGGATANAKISSYKEIKGIGFAEYTNIKNGFVDVIITGTSDNDFVGYIRIYENGNPTNRWTSKMENRSANRENFKTMIEGVKELLPPGHEYTEITNISLEGLRIYANNLKRGYEILRDSNGKPVINNVPLNKATIVGLQQAKTQEEVLDLYEERTGITRDEFNQIKEQVNNLLPGTQSLYNEANGSIIIKLPVLKSVSGVSDQQQPTPEAAPVSTDAKADIPIGKVGNTNYEVKADGVYFEGKKLDNPKNKSHRQLIEADIERRRQEELNAKDKQSGELLRNRDNDILEKRRIIQEFIDTNGEVDSIKGWMDLREDIQELLWEGKFDEAKAKVPKTYEEKINAKYGTELATLGTTDAKADIEAKKTDIEKRKQEELKADKLNNSLSEFELEDTPPLKTGSTSKRFKINKDGKNVGIVSLKIDENGNVRIAYMDINESSRRQGLAEKFYKDLNKALQKNKQGVLHSDKVWLDDLSKREKRKWFLDGTQLTEEEITALKKDIDKLLELDEQGRLTYEEEKQSDILPAQQLWEKLVNQGFAEKLEDGTYRFKYDAELDALEGSVKPIEEQSIPGERVGNFIIRQNEDGKWKVFNLQGESLGLLFNTREEAISDISRSEELDKSYDKQLYYNLKEIEEDPAALERIARDANGITLLENGELQFNPDSDITSVTRTKYHPDIIDLANKKFPMYEKAAKDYFDSKLSKPEDPITDEVWERFRSTSNVDQDTLNSIAQKYSTDPDSLSLREKKILSAKIDDIDSIINSLLKNDKLSVFPIENTEAEYDAEKNFVSRHIDSQKSEGLFTFVSSGPNEVVMEKDKPSIVDNVVQTKNTTGNQTSVYRRHRNVLDRYSDKDDPNGFFSTTEDGRRRFKLKIILANKNNEGWYVKTLEKPYLIAVIVDQDNRVINFDEDGNIVSKDGTPLGFEFQMGEYSSSEQKSGVPNIFLTRSSIIFGDESKSLVRKDGLPIFEEIYKARVKEAKENNTTVNFDPTGDLSNLIFSGVDIFANFDTVLNSKLSSSTINNKFSVSANQNVDSSAKTLGELIELGFIKEDTIPEIDTLSLTYFTDMGGQNIKVGSAYVSIPNTKIKIPLFGKKIKDLTIDGNRIFQSEDGKETYTFGKVLKTIQSKENIIPSPETSDIIYQITIDSFLQKTKDTEDSPYVVTDEASFVKLFEFLESLFYSKDVEVILEYADELPYAIKIKDKRVEKTSFSEYRININKPKEGFDRSIQQFIFNDNRFETEENEPYIFSYLSFVKDNFQTTALPAKIGEKNGQPIINFAKLNRRVIFTLEKSYSEIEAKLKNTTAKASKTPQEADPQTEETIKNADNIASEDKNGFGKAIDDITFEC
jgi:hypothetical protein